MNKNIKFFKYQGAGNDFILIDNRNGGFDRKNEDLIKKLCDRRFGIGADGLMLLEDNEDYDFEMIYFNANGKEGTMCGNGGRCIVAFARDLGIIEKETDFLAVDGPHKATIIDNQVNLEMINVREVGYDGEAFVLNTGSPHYVLQVDQLQQYDVYGNGKAIRTNDTYGKQGINVNFVEPIETGYFLRTFERGVEDETLACGTGATATAMAMAIKENKNGSLEIPVRVMGGQLYISFDKKDEIFTNVHLKGPAEFVFSGEIKE
jgi:diaminopimelate epimerase